LLDVVGPDTKLDKAQEKGIVVFFMLVPITAGNQKSERKAPIEYGTLEQRNKFWK
jgi:hypothetical protein